MSTFSTLPPGLVLMMMGALATGAILNLWIWLRRWRNFLHLWMAAWCAISGLYLASHYLQIISTEPHGVLLGSRLTWLSALLLAPVMVGLTQSIVRRKCSTRVLLLLGGLTLLLASVVLFTDLIVAETMYLRTDQLGGQYWAATPGRLVALPIPYLFGLSIYCFWLVWRAEEVERTERRVILGGFGVYILFALNDALHAARIIQSVRIFDYAFVPVALLLTYLEVTRYTALSESLELEVAARTSELHARQEQLRALVRSGQSVMAGIQFTEILDRIVHEAARIAGTPHVKVMMVDRAAKVLRVAACAGSQVPSGFEVPIGESYSGTIAVTGQPMFIGDTQNDPRNLLAQRDRETGIRTFLGLPIQRKGEVLGVLTFNTEAPREYSHDEIGYLTSFANQAAIAIEHARLYGALEDRISRLDTLTSLNWMISDSLDVDHVLRRIASAAATLMDAALVIVWTVDPGRETLSGRAASSEQLFAAHPNPRFRFGEGIIGRVAAARQPLAVPDLITDHRARDGAWFVANGFRAGAVFPILRRDELLGVLSLVFREPLKPGIENDPLLRAFIDQAAIAIDHGRLYRQLENRMNELHTVTRLNRLVSSSLDSDRVLREIARSAVELPGTAVASFWLAHEASKTLEGVGFSDPAMEADFPYRTVTFDQGVIGWVARHGRLLNEDDALAEGRVLAPEWWQRHGLKSFLGVPVILDGALLAVLALNGREPFRLDAENERMLESFADQAALAIRNSALYAAEGAARHAAERALAEVKRLQGMLPICSYCKKIRNDENSWEQLESYISDHSSATFSHGICPDCRDRARQQLESWRARK